MNRREFLATTTIVSAMPFAVLGRAGPTVVIEGKSYPIVAVDESQNLITLSEPVQESKVWRVKEGWESVNHSQSVNLKKIAA